MSFMEIYKDSNKVYFICVKNGNGYYLSGPVCAETLSYVEIHRYYKEYRITTDQERHPVRRSLSKLLNFVSLFYELLEGVSVDVDTLMLKNDLVQAQGDKTEKDKVMLEMEIIDEDIYHHTYNEERYMMECIREGRPDEGVERMIPECRYRNTSRKPEWSVPPIF